jgi:esterase/lipase
MNTYSKSFLSRTASRKKIESWIEFICATNTLVGLLALLTQTHTDDSDTDTNATTDFSSRSSGDDNLSNKEYNNFWHPISMAKRIANNQSPTIGRIHVGEHDHLATCQEARRLNEVLGWSRLHDVVTFPGSGHAVCIEQARNWRNNVIAFLSTE